MVTGRGGRSICSPLRARAWAPFAVHMNGRYLGRALLDWATERGKGDLQLLGLEVGPGGLAQQLSLQVVAAGDAAELDHPPVGLVPGEVGQQPRGGAEGDRQNPRHRRVQGAAMAHTFQGRSSAADG